MKWLYISLVALVSVVVTACSITGTKPPVSEVLMDTTGQNGRACVRGSDIQSFGVMKGDVVSINAIRGYYLATLLPGCNSLNTSPVALFDEQFGDVCGGGVSRVSVGDDTCTIKHLFEFDSREEAQEMHRTVMEEREKRAQDTADNR